jgi:hypothetical protein
MLDKLKGAHTAEDSMDPISMLKADHSKVKELFDQFERSSDKRSQRQLAKNAIEELKIHAAIEEEIFYPGVEDQVDDEEIMAEATEEHHVVHMLIDELERENLDPDVFHAKFIVLAENVRHHIKEEEGEMMPKIDAEASDLQKLGERMTERKEELLENPESLNRRRTGGSKEKSSSPQQARGGKTNGRRSASRTQAASGKSRRAPSRSPGRRVTT